MTVARAKAESLKRQIAQIDSNISFLENRSVPLQDLNRQVAQEEQNYQTYSKKLEESLISDDMDRRKMIAISVIEKAAAPMGPKEKATRKRTDNRGGISRRNCRGYRTRAASRVLGSGHDHPPERAEAP